MRVDRYRLLVHVPVDQHTPPAVPDVVLSEQVLIERPEMGRVRGHRTGAGAPDDFPAGGERRVGDRGGERAGPFGREVPAADVAEVFLGVAVFTGGDRSQADVGAVAEDAQDQPLGEHRGVDPRPGTGRCEVLQQADPQHRLLEHVQQRHQPPPGTDLRLQPVQVPGFRCRIQRGQGDLTAPAGADLQPRQARQRLLQRLQFGGHLPAQRVDELIGGQRLRQLRVIRPAAVLEVGGQVLLRVAPSVRAFHPDLFAAQPFPQSPEQAQLVHGAQHAAVRRFTAVGQIDPVAVHDARSGTVSSLG